MKQRLYAGKLSKLFICLIFSIAFFSTAISQIKTSAEFSKQLLNIEIDQTLSKEEKLPKVFTLKTEFEKSNLNKDSVYAKILHRIGVLEYSIGKTDDAIKYTNWSIRINISGRKECSKRQALISYFNLGLYYQQLHLYKESLTFYDKCIGIANEYKDSAILDIQVKARIKKGNIYFQIGDYEQDLEEAGIGLKTAFTINNIVNIVDLLNERAQAYISLGMENEALNSLQEAFLFIKKNDYQAYAKNYQIRAKISKTYNNYTEAITFFKKSIYYYLKATNTFDLAAAYNDAADTYQESKLYYEAKIYLNKSLSLAKKIDNPIIAAKASNNLALISLITHNYSTALIEYHNSLLQIVPTFKDSNALNNPTYHQCNAISDKNFLALLLGNKTECLLFLYKQTKDKKYITSALNTALLTDSIITDMRHEQTGEQSKLYWRDETREFFTNAIEACYQAADGKRALYFMEKSRAVLLNDKLNELGASAYLPSQEAQKEQAMQINVLSLQQQLAQLKETDSAYDDQQVKLLQAKEDFENYIKTLQDKYPAYYQYKYADEVPRLIDLQKYLKNNQQSFVHYFITDTTIYILGITEASVKFIKLGAAQFNTEMLSFLKICSDQQTLNNHYNNFAALSHSIYQKLFSPLQLPAGRVVICYDNYLIPFEALTTDKNGRDFLINNYTFSYVYSARFLLKNFNNPRGSGNFLGVAPVSYAGYLRVPGLLQSETSLYQSASFFNGFQLITKSEANKSNFLKLLPRYTIVTVLSHARADSTDKEPMLFMSDSIIRLSELQRLQNPATKLVVLSACQTNVGKIATGEGIISLARGFASAGIPSISATLWKADENAIYNITQTFLQNISQGMRKDDALQKAKLAYMQSGASQNLLPFFWANLILAGNGDPVKLAGNNHIIALVTGTIFITAILAIFIIYFRRKRLRKMLFTKFSVYK